MSRESCISHPANERLIVIKEWQLEAAGNPCGAALLSFFEYWHTWKLDCEEKAVQANAIAAKHGDPGTQDASLYQFHTTDQIEAGIMGLYSKDKIREAIKDLEAKGFI